MFKVLLKKKNLNPRQEKTAQAGYDDILKTIDQRLSALEEAQAELHKLLAGKRWSIEKVIIDKMHTDKFELNLDTIDVENLSGVLTIGLNYGGKVVKIDPKEGRKKETVAKNNTGDYKRDKYLGNGNRNETGGKKEVESGVKINFGHRS